MRSGLPDVFQVSTSVCRLTDSSSTGIHVPNRLRYSSRIRAPSPSFTERLRLPRDAEPFVDDDRAARFVVATAQTPKFFDDHRRKAEINRDFLLPFARDVREDEVLIDFFPSDAAQ